MNDQEMSWGRKARGASLAVLALARDWGRAIWRVARQPVILAFNVTAALVILFEEWGWRPLHDFIARLARFKLVARLERGIAALPPYAALAVFALPVAVLFPLKFVALWLLANGQWWMATALFIGAKITSTALIARIFTLTQPALMQLGWFERAYNRFTGWKDAFFAHIRASSVWRYGRLVKARVGAALHKLWPDVRSELARAFTWLKNRSLNL